MIFEGFFEGICLSRSKNLFQMSVSIRTWESSKTPANSRREGDTRTLSFHWLRPITNADTPPTVLTQFVPNGSLTPDSYIRSQPNIGADVLHVAGVQRASLLAGYESLMGHFRVDPRMDLNGLSPVLPPSTGPVDSGSFNHEIGSGPVYGFTLSMCTVIGLARLVFWITTLTGLGVAITKNGPLNFLVHLSCRPTYLRGLK